MLTEVYNNPDFKLETRYTVEYLTQLSEGGAQRWKLYQNSIGRNTAFEPWELVDKKEFSDAADAWQFYLARLLDPQTYVVHPIFEEILVNGILVRETYLEEAPTFRHRLCSLIDREMRREMDKLQKQAAYDAETISDYAEFIKLLPKQLKDDFQDFTTKKWRERNE